MSLREIEKKASKMVLKKDGYYALLLYSDRLELWKMFKDGMFHYVKTKKNIYK